MTERSMKATIRYRKRQRTVIREEVVQEDAIVEVAFDHGHDEGWAPSPEKGMDPGRAMLPRPTKPLPRSCGVTRPDGSHDA